MPTGGGIWDMSRPYRALDLGVLMFPGLTPWAGLTPPPGVGKSQGRSELW
jgi:hypothetical protein